MFIIIISIFHIPLCFEYTISFKSLEKNHWAVMCYHHHRFTHEKTENQSNYLIRLKAHECPLMRTGNQVLTV